MFHQNGVAESQLGITRLRPKLRACFLAKYAPYFTLTHTHTHTHTEPSSFTELQTPCPHPLSSKVNQSTESSHRSVSACLWSSPHLTRPAQSFALQKKKKKKKIKHQNLARPVYRTAVEYKHRCDITLDQTCIKNKTAVRTSVQSVSAVAVRVTASIT